MNTSSIGCTRSLKHKLQVALVASMSTILLGGIIPSVQAQVLEPEENYLCTKDDDVRRIEIRFKDNASQLPCRVVYRPETESGSVGTVSWRGIDKVDQCKAQALEIVERLTAESWTCVQLDEKPDPERNEMIVARLPNKASPSISEPTDQAASTEETEATATASLIEPDIENELRNDDGPLIPVLLENPDLEAPSPELESVVKGDLDKIAQTLDGKLEAEILSYEDLNSDGAADALVVLTYRSPQPAYRQFLSAYLFDDEAYQLAATRLIASSSTDTLNAALDEVDQGMITLLLDIYMPGDDVCCPSGSRSLNLELQGLELVEINGTMLQR